VRWNLVEGKLLQALANKKIDAERLPQAKTFLRGLIHHYLGGKPLATRQLLKVN
jgi:recombinational DNA repair protein (RecF pathway)